MYNKGMMFIETEMGRFWTEAHPTDPSKLVLVSTEKSTLEAVVDNIELMGRADDYDFDDLAIHTSPYPIHFTLELDRGTFVLWFDFEVRYFQHIERGN